MIYIHLLAMIILTGVCFITLIFSISDNDDNESLNISFASMILAIILCAFFIFGMAKCEKSKWIVDETPYAVENIVSLNDNNLTHGKIYLRSGYIEEDLYYQYIVRLSNGGFKTKKVKSANVTLFYDADNYRVEWYTKTKSWLYFSQEATYVKIYIPKGSITTDYSIDLN